MLIHVTIFTRSLLTYTAERPPSINSFTGSKTQISQKLTHAR